MDLIRILFIGCPGAGKGTQSKMFPFLTHISTGDLYRNAKATKDPLIMPYVSSVDAGSLLPDEIIFDLIKQKVSNLPQESRGYILDGAVRTKAQAEFAVQRELAKLVVEFAIPYEEAIKRLELRKEKENRPDDSPESIKKRFIEFEEKTIPAMEHLSSYSRDNILRYFIINAHQTPEMIYKNISRILAD